ncbi:lengsin-like [Haliotis rufescens]|uniref:lengsin-like n=1 Tax=Haliotis rufescens TaxID=6454 RepID=UPI00201EE5F7|nr:lengsin-like [Haliotis rufescens]
MSQMSVPYDYLRLTVCDVSGKSRGRILHRRHAEHVCRTGVTVGVGVPASLQKDFGFVIIPDLSTIKAISWDGGEQFKVAEVICDAYWLKDKTPVNCFPRYAAKQQLQRLANNGYTILSGFEMEYMLYYKDLPASGRCRMHHLDHTKHSAFLYALDNGMHNAGVDVENFHTEWDAGLFEGVLKASKGITAADWAFTFRSGTLEVATKHTDYEVSFLSRQETGEVGMHYNHSVLSIESGENIFSDSSKPDGISDFGRCWLGGLLKHSRALSAFWCPTVNCYDRLHRPRRPRTINWALENRLSSFRVKADTDKQGVYFENRIPSGSSNPYLTLAATIAAGLDGVLNNLDCPAQCPDTEEPAANSKSANTLPTTLPEALSALQADSDLVNILGKELVEWFLVVANRDIERCN